MSKNPRPTSEELEFVYGLILSGFDDKDILNEYLRLDKDATLTFPMRTDKRFVRERRKELSAVEAKCKEHLKAVDPVIAKKRDEHFVYLAEIANLLLDGGLDRISNIQNAGQFEIIEEGYTIRTLSRDQLIATLEENLVKTYQQYADWQVDGQLFAHIKAEYHSFSDVYGYINRNPIEVVDILRTLAQRKTFKGTCPVCEDWQ
ncbi:hypothetical protein ACFLVM_03560 [Chloroflexota bacterium]